MLRHPRTLLTIGSNCISCHVVLSGSDIFETHTTSGRTELISMAGGSRLTIIGGIYLAAESIPQAISSTNAADAVTVLGAEKENQIAGWVGGAFASFVTHESTRVSAANGCRRADHTWRQPHC